MDDANVSIEGGRIIPQGTVAVTVGIDTQADGFYYVVVCWGRKMEVWLPLTDRITGDMRTEAPWNALTEILSTTWLDKNGNGYSPVMSGLDIQGDFYPQCLEYIRACGYRYRLRAMRGLGRDKTQAGRGFGILRNVYTDKPTGVRVQNIDVDIAKTAAANMLARKDPLQVHLPCGPDGEVKGGWDEEAVAELTAEYRRTSNSRGYTVERWYKRSGRANHRLDCFCYSLAALALSRLKIDECEVHRVEARNVGKPVQEKERPKYGAQVRTVFGDLSGWADPFGFRTLSPPGHPQGHPRWGAQYP